MFVRQQDNKTTLHAYSPRRKTQVDTYTQFKTSQTEMASTKQSPNTLNLPSLAAPWSVAGYFGAEGQRCEWGVPTWSHHHGLVFIITNLKIDPINAGLKMMLQHRHNNAWLGFFSRHIILVRATQWARRQANAFWPCRKLIEPIVSGWWQNKLENCQ